LGCWFEGGPKIADIAGDDEIASPPGAAQRADPLCAKLKAAARKRL